MTKQQEIIVHNLQTLMTEAKLNMRELARLSGISQTAIHQTLTKKTQPTLATLENLALFFGVTVGQILGEKPLKTPTTNVPIIEWGWLNCLTGSFEIKDNANLHYAFTDYKSPNSLFALKIPTDIYPSLPKNSIIIIEYTPNFQNGNMLLVCSQNNAPVIQKVIAETETTYLKSLTSDIPPQPLNSHTITIFGVLREVRIIY